MRSGLKKIPRERERDPQCSILSLNMFTGAFSWGSQYFSARTALSQSCIPDPRKTGLRGPSSSHLVRLPAHGRTIAVYTIRTWFALKNLQSWSFHRKASSTQMSISFQHLLIWRDWLEKMLYSLLQHRDQWVGRLSWAETGLPLEWSRYVRRFSFMPSQPSLLEHKKRLLMPPSLMLIAPERNSWVHVP